MTTSLLQIRVDTNLKNEAAQVFDNIGLDISTAVRMFLKRSIFENGLPFKTTLPKEDYKAIEAFEALERLSAEAKANGTSNLTLEEINAEIRAVREEREKNM